MCRIYGYLGQLRPADLDSARDAQLSGGPDEQRYVVGENWGLGCNRLSIQDPSTGSQPFTNAGGTVHLVFNGEIYNFRAIRDELARHGVEIRGDCDGSVLLPYYELLGDGFVGRLEGMFAIALVDLRQEPLLKLWCDPLAIKCVYYTVTSDAVAFSSELRGLSALTGTAFDVDPYAIDGYLDLQCIGNGASLFTGVSHLLPGEHLAFDGDRVIRTLVTDADVGTPEAVAAYDFAPAGLRTLLEDEVARMSLQASPIAVQLSGGLDSSILATLLHQRRGDVTGFHITYEGQHVLDELTFARDAAEHARISLEVVRIGADELPDLIPAVVTALGTPNATPHSLSAFVLFQEISRCGFRVCFVGDGADEQFGGYRRYLAALTSREQTWRSAYLDRLSLVPEAEYLRLYSPEYRALLDSGVRSRERSLELLSRPASSRLEQLLVFDLLHKLPGLNLRKLDHLGMAHAVEARVPYCQPTVTRFARRTPDDRKVDGSRVKRVLWDAGPGLVPPSVQGRNKQPFTLPVDTFMVEGTKLWEFTMDVLAEPKLCREGFLDREALRNVITEHMSGADYSRLIWGLMVLELSLP